MSKGMFASFLESTGIVEGDGTAPAPKAPAPQAAPLSSPLFQNTTAPQAVPLTIISPEDQKAVDALNSKIFASPSNYTLFRDFHARVGGGSDIRRTLDLLTAANPGISVGKIKMDIRTALDMVAAQKSDFERTLDQAKQDRVQGPDSDITALNQQIAQAQSEIARLQTQIASQTQQIATLQQKKQEGEQAINAGRLRFNAIVAQIEKPLLDAQAVFSSIQ